MPGKNRVLCTNSGGYPDEVREAYGETFAHCPACQRVTKPRKDGSLRDHSVRGRNTASLDHLYGSLFLAGEAVAR